LTNAKRIKRNTKNSKLAIKIEETNKTISLANENIALLKHNPITISKFNKIRDKNHAIKLQKS